MKYDLFSFLNFFPNFHKIFISSPNNLIYLTFFILYSFSCSQVSISEISKNNHNGDIYGNVVVRGVLESVDSITVFISGKSYSSRTDSNGCFFISDIPEGNYFVTARAKGFADCIIKKVEVSNDSITLIAQHILKASAVVYERIWRGIKIKRVDINSRGNMKGSVVDAQTNRNINDAAVIIEGTPWIALTDSTGTFDLGNILPGVYNLITSKLGFHQIKVCNINIKAGQTSLVDFRLVNIGIPERPLPYKWKSNYLNK